MISNDSVQQNDLISFYKSEGTDHSGRKIEDIWAFSPFELEHTHDYIQWLFPIPETGRFNRFAPTLDPATSATFASSPELRQRQHQSLSVMLKFLGLEFQQERIAAAPELNMKDHIWLKAGGHNHLRISRIIRSLHCCGQPELARMFQSAVLDIGTEMGNVSDKSKEYWRRANEPPAEW